MATKVFVLIAFLGFLFLASCLAVAAYRLRRAAKSEYEQLLWIRDQAERALGQVKSREPNQVIAGLQTLRAMNDPHVLVEALQSLEELTHSNDPEIAEHARATYKRLLVSLGRLSRGAIGAD